MSKRQTQEPMPLFDTPPLVLTCGNCGFAGDLDAYDVAGADDGNVFCNRCTGEIDAVTGVVAEPDVDGEFYEDLERLVNSSQANLAYDTAKV